MFYLRRHRGARRRTQRLLAVALAVAASSAVASPVSAAPGEGGTSTDSGPGRFGGVAYYAGSVRPGNASGCVVINYEGVGKYHNGAFGPGADGGHRYDAIDIETVIITEESEGGGRRVVVGDGEFGSGDEAIGGDDRLIDPEAGPSFRTEIVDGRFDHEGDAWGVWRVECDPDNPDDYQIVAAPLSPLALIPPAIDAVEDLLPEPELELMPFDEANNWTYVQVPIDFRTTPETLEPIVITADTGGPEAIRQWITITAEPSKVIYASGDPLAAEPEVECGAEFAADPYVAETPGECSYTHLNASSVVDGGKFQAELRIEWEVTYVAKGGTSGVIDVDPTVQEEEVAVAEVKAVTKTRGP